MTALPPLAAVILTYNEALHIRRCIERVRPIASRIIIVDSFSTDGTVEIARELGAEIFQQKFVNHAAQFQWGIDQAAIADGWVLRIDADEYFEPAALAEISERLATLPAEVGAVDFRRKLFFNGKWIRWGGYYKNVLTRLWRAGAARIEQRWMDEHVVVEQGETVRFARGDLVDDNLKDISWWTEKHVGYSVRQMIEFMNLEHPELLGTADQGRLSEGAKRKRFLRNGVYNRMPLYLRALLYYLVRYVLRLGFLDGRTGFVFHAMHGYWYFLLMDAQIDQARKIVREGGVEGLRDWLAERHGIRVGPDAAPR
jgi:glycosyltransferase involved in cell wall biosynthesis